MSLVDRMAARAQKPPEPGEAPGLAARLRAVAQRETPAGLDEVLRACGLPIVSPVTDREIEVVSREQVQADYFDRGFRLWRMQVEGLLSFVSERGLFVPGAVGAGKSLTFFAAAKHAQEKMGVERVLLLVPPNAYNEMLQRHVPMARRALGYSPPINGFSPGMDAGKRAALAKSGRRGLYVLPYSFLSTKDTDALLRAIRPGLVICDEAHEVRNKRSAKVRRFLSYMNETPWPMFIGLSGTITNRELRDFHHLVWLALRYKMPMPISPTQTDEWAACIDASADEHPPMRDQLEIVAPLRDWAVKNAKKLDVKVERLTPDVAGIRRSFRARLVSCPGIVATDEALVGTTLRIANRPVPEPERRPGWERLKQVERDVISFPWKTPSGDVIEHAIHTWKYLFELSAGFYNELVWPSAPVLAKRRQTSEAEAEGLLARAEDHHQARQIYARALRAFFDDDHVSGLDTPELVGNDMHHHGARNVPGRLYEKWSKMKSLEFDGMPKRDANAVRVCDFKVRHAVEWAEKLDEGRGALVWVHNREVGEWAVEALAKSLGSGRVLHCPSGDESNAAIFTQEAERQVVVASIGSHGRSKNLQAFQEQFFLQCPRSAWIMEQVLGRTHRPGQQADVLTAHFCNTTEFDMENFGACLVDSVYEHVIDSRRKVVYANYETMPEVYPSQFLRERGFENRILTTEQERLLMETFNAAT